VRRLYVIVAVVALVAVTAGGCARSGAPAHLVVGAIYPTTGSQAPGGSAEARGVGLAVEWANAHGGVHGRQLDLAVLDTPSAEAVPAAMESLRRRGVSVVIGSHGSPISAVAADVATQTGMSFWETGAVGQVGPDTAGSRNFFRLSPMGANLGRAAISFVRDELAPKLAPAGPLRYAVAYVDDAYGRAVGEGAAAEAGVGGNLVGTFPYDATTTDFGALAAQIGAAHPDVLFVSAYLDDGIALRRAVVAAGIPLAANIGTSSSYCMPSFGEALGDAAVGLFASDKPDAADIRSDALSDEGRQALTWVSGRYQDRYHEPMDAPALSGFANASALLSHVLPAATSLRADDVAAAAVRVKLARGTLANGAGLDLAPADAPDAGANRNAAGVIWEWVAPRTRAVVWPPAYATHPIVATPTGG